MTVATAGIENILREHGIAGSLDALGAYVARQRWSGALHIDVRDVRVDDAAVLTTGDPTLIFTITRIAYADGRVARYALPIGLRPVGDPLAERSPDQLIGTVATDHGDALLYDALGDPAYIHELWNRVRDQAVVETTNASLRFDCPDPAALEPTGTPAVRPLRVEQSNTSMEIGEATFLKHLRRIEPGPAHELEMAAALRRSGFEHFVPVLGAGMYAEPGEPETPFLLIQPYLRNATEGWALALTSLRDLYADAEEPGERDPAERRAIVDEQRAAFLGEAARLGTVVAQMHLALAQGGLGEAFEPQPVTRATLDTWADEMSADLAALLRRPRPDKRLLAARATIQRRFDALRKVEPGGLLTRIHGDLHLGQVLRTDSGWTILDFEGEPDRAPSQRRRLGTPLQDVAGMLRSLDYAAAVSLDERLTPASRDWATLMAYGDDWAQANRDAFWSSYLHTIGDHPVVAAAFALEIRHAFEVHKALYEVGYELAHRPGWVDIPLRFLTRGAE